MLAALCDARLEPQRQTPTKATAPASREKDGDMAGSCLFEPVDWSIPRGGSERHVTNDQNRLLVTL
jgi:hypothetical protein